MLVPLNFGIQSNPGRYGTDGTGSLINCYAEARGPEGKSPIVVYADPGLKSFGTFSATKGTRGLIELGDVLYWVVDRQIRKVDATGTSTFIAGLADDGKVTMARNTKSGTPQIAIATQGGLRFVLENDQLTPIADPDLPPPIGVEFEGGYILYLLPSGEFFYSEINDAANIDALNFQEAESSDDGGVAIKRHRNYVYIFGTQTVEVFQNTGGTDNPFTSLSGGLIPKGCLSAGTVAEIDHSLVFVTHENNVARIQGSTASVISTTEVADLIRKEPNPESLTGDVYAIQGHEFYALSGTSFTRVWDASTGLWHDKKSSGLERWIGQCVIQYGRKWICGDYRNGNLYEIDPETFGENGADMTVELVSPIIHNFPNRLQHNSLYADFVTGVGLNSTDTHNSDPQVTLQHSDDGGVTWSNARTRSLGKIGERNVRVKWNRLGTDRNKGRTYRLQMSPQVVRSFIGAAVDVEQVAA